MTLQAILEAAMQLPPEQRVELVDQLSESLGVVDNDLTPEQREDLRHRIEEDKAGRSNPQPWDEFYAKLRNRD